MTGTGIPRRALWSAVRRAHRASRPGSSTLSSTLSSAWWTAPGVTLPPNPPGDPGDDDSDDSGSGGSGGTGGSGGGTGSGGTGSGGSRPTPTTTRRRAPTPTETPTSTPSSTPSSSTAPSSSVSDTPSVTSTPTQPAAGQGTGGAATGTDGGLDTPSTQPGQPAADPVTVAAVQTALGTEYAAVWCYGLVQAFLPGTLNQRTQEDLVAHRTRRDTTLGLLADYGVTPRVAEAAYATPSPVKDQNSAMRLVVAAETDAAAAWRSVLASCDDPGLRRTALDGLSDAAVRGARWSEQLGASPPVSAFPGRQ